MKKLTAADLELLKARGKVKSLTTSTDFELPESWNNKPKKAKKTVKKAKVNHPLVGRMLHTSWGYDMTINNFAQILEVSPTGKTVVCRMLPKEGFNGFTGVARAGKTTYGPKFRLKVKESSWGSEGYSFNGSYPFVVHDEKADGFMNEENSSRRMGYFSLYDGRDVYENHMD